MPLSAIAYLLIWARYGGSKVGSRRFLVDVAVCVDGNRNFPPKKSPNHVAD